MTLKNFIERLFRYFGRGKDKGSSATIPDDVREKYRRYQQVMENLDAMGNENMLSPEALHAGFVFALGTSPEAGAKFVESLQIVEQAAAKRESGRAKNPAIPP